MSITTTHFVSVSFTLRVWRGWIRNHLMQLRRGPRVRRPLSNQRVYWVFGSARSGTTWLMEVLQRGFGLHSIHEPTFRHNPDFPQSDIDTKVRIATQLSETGVPADWLQKLVSGQFANPSIDRSNPTLPLRRPRGVVLKEIDFRLLQITALTSLHPQAVPVVILRQPIDSLKSMITAQEIWQNPWIFGGDYLDEFADINADVLSADALSRIEHAKAQLTKSDFRQIWIAKWCLQNLVALESQSDNPKLKVVLYERMMRPVEEARSYLEAIFGRFDRDPKLGKRSQTDMRKPPGTTPNIESETAEMISIFGLAPFTLPGQPHLIDLEALVADYRKPASARLTPRFMR